MLLVLLSPAAWSQIMIGQVAGFKSATSKEANDMALGARVLIAAVNAHGGVLGKTVALLQADDNYKPEETAKEIEAMAGKVSALLPAIGSANVNYVLKTGLLDRITLPIVGTIPSNESFRNPPHKNLFHFRAGDRAQLEKIVEQLTTVGIKNIAVLARKNPSSDEGIVIIREALEKRGSKLSLISIYDVTAKTFETQVKYMQEKQPDAIILLGTQQGIANVTKELKAGGVNALLYAVSYADFKLISSVTGPAARGFVISQVMPNLNKTNLPLIRAFREDFAKYADTKEEPSHYHLEGYIAARLIVEAIRRTKDASPEGVKRGLEQMHQYDLGGYIVDFSATKHAGSTWVDLSMLSAAGLLVY
jgi:ABC-type branched-subunit amino acid transport system substrate-binding protein